MQMSYSLLPLKTPAGPFGQAVVPSALLRGLRQVSIEAGTAEQSGLMRITGRKKAAKGALLDSESAVFRGVLMNAVEEDPDRLASMNIFTNELRKQRIDLECFNHDILSLNSASKFFLRGVAILYKRFYYLAQYSERLLPAIGAILFALGCALLFACNADSPAGRLFDTDRIFNRYGNDKMIPLSFSYIFSLLLSRIQKFFLITPNFLKVFFRVHLGVQCSCNY